MQKKYIEKALTQNDVNENDIVRVKTDTTTTFYIHLLRMLVLLLYNFSMQMQMTASDVYNFIMQNFNTIVDIVITELEISLHNFTILYAPKFTDIVELHNKDECLLVLTMQDKVNKKLRNLMKKERI